MLECGIVEYGGSGASTLFAINIPIVYTLLQSQYTVRGGNTFKVNQTVKKSYNGKEQASIMQDLLQDNEK